MNPLLSDDIQNSKSPCQSYNNKGIQRLIEKGFNNELYKDPNDIFDKNNSQRQFFTIPGREFMNDRDSYQKWLYQTPPTCKEGNGLSCGTRSGPGPGRKVDP